MSTAVPANPTDQFTEDEMTLADVYAEALIDAAQEAGQLDEVAAEMVDLVRYMNEDPEFARFLTAESVDDEPRRVSLEKLFRGKMSDLLLNTLQVLNNRRRLGLLRAVARCGQLRMEARRHEQEVTVRTARPLTESLREEVRRVVSEYIGKQALLLEEVDPGLIGGMVLQIGDVRVDASVTARLRILRQRLTQRATAEVHRGDRYIVEA